MYDNVKKVYGPYLRSDGRKHVVLRHVDNSLQTVSYPKYLLEISLNTKLLPNETADHIDENLANNDLSNLDILSRKENVRKSIRLNNPEQIYVFDCPICGKTTHKLLRNVKGNLDKGKKGPYCSRQCAGKAQ